MRNALWQLGFHDCYHMHTLIDDPSRAPQWVRAYEAKYAAKGTFAREDWDRLLGDCQAVCDIPAAFFGADIADAYPEAKVIILNRDPEQWYDSVLHSIYPFTRPKALGTILKMIYCFAFDDSMRKLAAHNKTMAGLAMGYDHGREKEKALSWYSAQYGEFRARIPAERRIEYSIEDGWKPLCAHLGVPVPMVRDETTGEMVEAPFPHLNDRGSFIEHSVKNRARATARATDNLWKLVGKMAVTGAVGYAGFLLWKTRLSGRM